MKLQRRFLFSASVWKDVSLENSECSFWALWAYLGPQQWIPILETWIPIKPFLLATNYTKNEAPKAFPLCSKCLDRRLVGKFGMLILGIIGLFGTKTMDSYSGNMDFYQALFISYKLLQN